MGLGKLVTKHRISAHGLLFGGFVLKNIPVFDQNSVLDTEDVRRNPIRRPAQSRESPVDDDEIAIGRNHPRFILERRWTTFNEVKESVAARLDMGAVLNVVRRPISLGLGVIPPIEQRIERLED